MMKPRHKRIDMIGRQYGRWTVIGLSDRLIHETNGYSVRGFLLCRCTCGTRREVRRSNLVTGDSTSCGCQRVESNTDHGLSNTPEYNRWKGMIARCAKSENVRYHRYGGRGIRVSKRWMVFDNFLADMGPLPFPAAQLDRKNNDGNYNKRNCRWTTHAVNMRNKSNSLLYTYKGQRLCLKDISVLAGISYQALRGRIKNMGLSFRDALRYVGPKRKYLRKKR